MAQKVQVVILCDLHDGEVEGSETVSFGLDGARYEIDLCDEHAAQLRDDLAGYVGAGRSAGRAAPARSRGRSGGSARRASARGGSDRVQAIRDWARENGHPVSERGRLSRKLVEAYDAAH